MTLRSWYGNVFIVLLATLGGIYFTNQAQVLLAAFMEGRAPTLPVAYTLIILHFDLAAFLAALALGWIATYRPWWVATAVGVLLLIYHGYWTHYYLDGNWRWWYLVRVAALPVFVWAGLWCGRWLAGLGATVGKVLWVAGYGMLGLAAVAYLIHLGERIAA